ncbi:MAG TPA: sigma-70 family RNA polymerase sigma factor [Candidatus Limnocylindrales bacterium]|nr:sigma-70 family RNA polymerase sigma factor [Candidatus Limnocylindrales bacterium]
MDRDLVVRARNGDHDAFTALAADAFNCLHRTARLILRGDDRAGDAVQEALVSAWIHIQAVRDPDRFEGWLYRLVVRACYEEARRSRRHELVEIRVATLGAKTGPDTAGLTADRDQLERGFRRLSPEQRAVLVVHYYLGMTEREAATVLDIPVGTVKSPLSRAIRALRDALEADERAPVLTRESTT